MMRLPRRALAALLLAPATARAQSWPSRPVRIIVPYPPGGATDIVGRLMAQELGTALGQSFVVENRGGAASITGTQAVASAPADGHVLGVVDTSFLVNPGLFGSRVPYDTQRDFSPVSLLVRAPMALVVPADAPWRTLGDLVAEAKAKPDSIAFGSAGTGTAVHMAGEQLRQVAGFTFLHVPYRGGGPMITDLLAGRVRMAFSTIPVIGDHVRGGRLRALATTGATRTTQLPDVPSMAEAGFPQVDASLLNALVGPAGLPEPIVTRLAEAARAAVNAPTMRARFGELGLVPVGSTPAAFRAVMEADIPRWAQIVRAGNITVD